MMNTQQQNVQAQGTARRLPTWVGASLRSPKGNTDRQKQWATGILVQSVHEQSRWVCAQLLLSVCTVYQVPLWCEQVLHMPQNVSSDAQLLRQFQQEQLQWFKGYLRALDPKAKGTQRILDEALLLCSVHEQLMKGNAIFDYCFQHANAFEVGYIQNILEQHWVLGLRTWVRQMVLRLHQSVCIRLIDQWENKADGVCVWLVRFVLLMKVRLGKKGTYARRWIGQVAQHYKSNGSGVALRALVQALWAFLSTRQRWLCFTQHQRLVGGCLTAEQCAPMWALWERCALNEQIKKGKNKTHVGQGGVLAGCL